jgi:hypothetical protein
MLMLLLMLLLLLTKYAMLIHFLELLVYHFLFTRGWTSLQYFLIIIKFMQYVRKKSCVDVDLGRGVLDRGVEGWRVREFDFECDLNFGDSGLSPEVESHVERELGEAKYCIFCALVRCVIARIKMDLYI